MERLRKPHRVIGRGMVCISVEMGPMLFLDFHPEPDNGIS